MIGLTESRQHVVSDCWAHLQEITRSNVPTQSRLLLSVMVRLSKFALVLLSSGLDSVRAAQSPLETNTTASSPLSSRAIGDTSILSSAAPPVRTILTLNLIDDQ